MDLSVRETVSSVSSVGDRDTNTSRNSHQQHQHEHPLLPPDASTVTVPGWPSTPQTLRRRKRDWIGHAIWIVVVVPYVILALYALAGQSKTISPANWGRVQTAIKVAVTVFPIAFAAIVSRMLRQICQWQLERAASLGSLEQLRRSSTVFGTLSILFVLRSLNGMGLGLLLLWALSPLGAQSALRILSAEQQQHPSTPALAYLDLAQTSQRLDPDVIARQNDLADQLFVSNILAPTATRLSSMDAWGNVKIPLVTEFQPDWTPIDNNNNSVVYSSLLGIPVLNLPPLANVTFTLHTSYMRADCFELATDPHARQLQPSVLTHNGVPLLKYIPEDSPGSPPDHTGAIIRWSSYNYDTSGGEHYTIANCTLAQIPLDAHVACLSGPETRQAQQTTSTTTKTSCAVTAVRQPEPPRDADLLNPLFDAFGAAMMNSTPAGHPYSPTLEDHYLNGIDLFNDSTINAIPALSNRSRPLFSQRLTQLLNTYATARLGYELIMADDPVDQASYSTAVLAHAPAAVSEQDADLTVVAHWPWVAVYLVATVVLVVAVVVAPVVQSWTRTPDILGYVSTMTRDNPGVRLATPASTLDGFERARLLRDVRVRLGDAQSEVVAAGRLRLGTVEATARARRVRVYE